jgi:hypothetical protein
MKKTLSLVFIFFIFFSVIILHGSVNNSIDRNSRIAFPDSLRERQSLYNGTEWKNEFKRIAGDQFLFANYFLPGSVTLNGRTFNNVQIKYDIFSDELLIARNLEQIVCMNKEMVDSFNFVFENKIYRFLKLNEYLPTEPKGYTNILYHGKSTLYVKYVKRMSVEITNESDGEFYQIYTIYFMKDGVIYPLKRIDDIYSIMGNKKAQIQGFIKENKLKVNRKVPESFIPVIRFYDTLNNQ